MVKNKKPVVKRKPRKKLDEMADALYLASAQKALGLIASLTPRQRAIVKRKVDERIAADKAAMRWSDRPPRPWLFHRR